MMPRDTLLHKKTPGPYNFRQIFNMADMDFSEFFGLLTSKNKVIGSILRLNAWYYLKAEKNSNQNI